MTNARGLSSEKQYLQYQLFGLFGNVGVSYRQMHNTHKTCVQAPFFNDKEQFDKIKNLSKVTKLKFTNVCTKLFTHELLPSHISVGSDGMFHLPFGEVAPALADAAIDGVFLGERPTCVLCVREGLGVADG